MKRIYWKELVLVSAPVLIVGSIFLGNRWRQQKIKSAQPHIVSCQFRTATPLEISQGADIGITAIAVTPKVPFPCTNLDYSLFDEHGRALDFKERGWEEGHANIQDESRTFEENRSYHWSNQAFWQHPVMAEVRLKSVCNVWPPIKQRFQLSTKGLVAPNPVAARHSNFRVTKAVLQYSDSRGIATRYQQVNLSVSNVSDESQGLMTKPYCVGKWCWQDSKTHSVYALAGEWVGSGNILSEVDISLDTQGVRVPPPKGTKIRGLLSINRGWPQEITLQWPEKLSQHFGLTEMKFSTRLAPFPSPKSKNS